LAGNSRAFKRDEEKVEKKLSLLAGNSRAFKRDQEKSRKKTFGGKIVLGKKRLRF